MMSRVAPELWLIAGPNGAGKTTFTQQKPLADLLENVRLLNADDLTLEFLQQQGYASFDEPDQRILKEVFIAAAEETHQQLQQGLRNGECIAVETVLSTDKYRESVEFVSEQDGFFGLIYIALNSPELACDRVRKRHRLGGHDLPPRTVPAFKLVPGLSILQPHKAAGA